MSQAPDDSIQVEIDQARAKLAGIVSTVDQQAELAERADARLQALSVQKWSPRREVCVTVDGHGLVQDIEYAQHAPSASPLALARALRQAHDAALSELRDAAETIANEELAGDDGLRNSLKRTYQEAIPDRVHEDDDE